MIISIWGNLELCYISDSFSICSTFLSRDVMCLLFCLFTCEAFQAKLLRTAIFNFLVIFECLLNTSF